MRAFEDGVRVILDGLVPQRAERDADWADVLARAGVAGAPQIAPPARPRWRVHRVAAIGIAIVALTLAASPVGGALAGLSRDAFDGLSSWVRGEPGTSAPAAEQAGFAARNASSYAAFPNDTKLRLLVRRRAGGESFSLLGFRSRSSLCLRLVRASRPAARGANQCVSLRELRASRAPALVVADTNFSVSRRALFVEAVFGFADDTVQSIELTSLRRRHRVVDVADNVFLALRAHPARPVRAQMRPDYTVQVRAVVGSGRRITVPFIAQDLGDYANGRRGPSYLGRGEATPVPGPTRVERAFGGGTIGWIERREPRGEPWAPEKAARLFAGRGATKVLFSRAVRPDPEDPRRVGIFLVRHDPASTFGRSRPAGVMLCMSELRPLTRGETGAACIGSEEGSPSFRAGQPVTISGMAPAQVAEWTGLAADEVARIDVHTGGGRVIPAALRDNVFAVSVPGSEAAKIVARDRDGRVIAIQQLPHSPKPLPCPPARLTRTNAPSATEPYQRIDLGARTVNGSPLFGRSPAEVERALGQPDRIARHSVSNGHPEPTFYYGGDGPNTADLIVQFGWRQQRTRLISFHYQGRPPIDARLGNLFALEPMALQDRIRRVYGRRYRLAYDYGSIPGRGCVAGFVSPSGKVELSFGVLVYRSGRPFLLFKHGY